MHPTPTHRTSPSDNKERPTEPERAKAWTALSHYHGGSLHTNVSVELKRELDCDIKSTQVNPCVIS